MVVAWLVYPAVVLLVAIGCGLCLDALCGGELPGTLIPSLGLAAVIVLATLTTIVPLTAPATPWILVAVAVLGLVGGRRRLSGRTLDPSVLVLAALVYLVCAAPIVLSGNATWLGYLVDNDPAFHFVLGAQLLAHGRSLANVAAYPFSSPDSLLHIYASSDYPVGTDVALAATAKLVGVNLAWALQPYLAVILTLGATALYELIGFVRSKPLRAVCAFVASITGLTYAFYLEASLKELACAWLITVVACLAATLIRGPRPSRVWLALAIAVIGEFAVLATAAVPWFVIPLATLGVVLTIRARRSGFVSMDTRRLAVGALGAVVVIAIAIPVASYAVHFIENARAVLTSPGNVGNLQTRLPIIEQFGIWPIGDFRQPIVGHLRQIHLLIAVAFVSAIVGTLWCLRRRVLGPLLLVIGNSAVSAVLLLVSSPYAAAKVMAIVSASVTLASMLGAAALYETGAWRGRLLAVRVTGSLLALVLGFGVLWTDALGYRDASVAPQGRYRQLAAIGSRFQGQGPAFLNVADEYGVWFLRQEGVQVPSTWGGVVPRPGIPARTGGQTLLPWDPNDLDLSYVEGFRLLVLARSPQFARPPANFRLVFQDRYYDVWRRTRAPAVMSHVSLTSATARVRPLSCASIVALGRRAAREHARIAYVEAPHRPSLDPVKASHPPQWVSSTENGEGDPRLLHLTQGAGSVLGHVHVRRTGRYAVWVEGSISEPIAVWIGRRYVGSISYQLAPPGQAFDVGTAWLRAGQQPVALYRAVRRRLPGDVFPGYAGSGELLGPVTLVPTDNGSTVQHVAPPRTGTLCGRSLEWVEIVRG